jgi:hypothetical protein
MLMVPPEELPPELAPDDVLVALLAPEPPDELEELEEPPQALTASTAMAASSAAAHGRTYLFTDPPPKRSCFPDRTIYDQVGPDARRRA